MTYKAASPATTTRSKSAVGQMKLKRSLPPRCVELRAAYERTRIARPLGQDLRRSAAQARRPRPERTARRGAPRDGEPLRRSELGTGDRAYRHGAAPPS